MLDEFLSLIAARHSKRAYLPKEVPRDILARVLSAAANAPSSKNTQPWRVAVVSGPARDHLSRTLCEKFDQGVIETPPYRYSPDPLPEGFQQRARACGIGIFKAKGIDRHDPAARRHHDRENYVFFHAPVVLFFHLPRNAERGNFLDMGFFMQNVMLGLLSFGISSCPQASVLNYAQTVMSFLNLPDRLLVGGLSAGYADPSAPVNSFAPQRLPLADFVLWRE